MVANGKIQDNRRRGQVTDHLTTYQVVLNFKQGVWCQHQCQLCMHTDKCVALTLSVRPQAAHSDLQAQTIFLIPENTYPEETVTVEDVQQKHTKRKDLQ